MFQSIDKTLRYLLSSVSRSLFSACLLIFASAPLALVGCTGSADEDRSESAMEDEEEEERETPDLVGRGAKKKARGAASAVESAHENMKRQFEGME